MFSCEFCEVFKSTVLENCERPILSCYFNNLKIFCFHVLELYQYFLSCKKYLTSINEDCSQEMSHKKNVPIESLITASSFYILIDLKLIFSIFIHLQQIFPPSGIFPRSGCTGVHSSLQTLMIPLKNYLLYLMRCVARWQIKIFMKKVIFVTAN